MLEFALVISLESVKCVEDSDVSSQRGCWRSESKNDVFGVGVGSGKFRFSPKKNRSAAHKPQDHHGLKTAGDKGAVDLSYLGMLWGGKGVGKAPEYLHSCVTKGSWSQTLSGRDGPQSRTSGFFVKVGGFMLPRLASNSLCS